MSWLTSDIKAVWIKNQGVPIDETQRNKWGIEGVEWLLENDKEYLTYSISGDSIVLSLRDPETGDIEVFDCKIQRKMRF
jgi:hypothetical protein